MLSLATALFAASVAGHALPPRQAADSSPVFFPLKYPYNGYPKVYTDIAFGTPAQTPVQTVVDLGSANFWAYETNASIHYGSTLLGVEGPCIQRPSPAYDVTASTSAADEIEDPRQYGYGGNSKIVTAYYSWNDTMTFSVDDGVTTTTATTTTLANQQIAVSNYSLVRQAAIECTGVEYDGAILGISEDVKAKTDGPSFRQNLLDRGLIESSTLSMWFDEAPEDVRDTFHGSALFGAVPTSKYGGKLTKVAKRQPENSIGYYVDQPVWFATKIDGSSSSSRVLETVGDATQCLIDSGSGQDYLPVDQQSFLDATGLITWSNTVAFDGSCEEMPRNGSLSLEFAGEEAGTSVTITIPLTNYVRGNLDALSGLENVTVCGLSLSLDNAGSCTLGSPFTSGAFLAFNDELGEIALAQGGVSTGSLEGAAGLGEVVTIGKGEGLSKVTG